MDSIERTQVPHSGESWQQFCERISADSFARFLRGEKVRVRYRNWRITLDTVAIPAGETSVTVTRMKVPYVNRDGFRFKIYRKDLFSALWKLCGMKVVSVGRADFDREFIIQGNDEAKLKRLFEDEDFCRLVRAQPSISLEVRDNEGWLGVTFPEGVDELCFRDAGFINDVERLKLLFALFAETLDRLCEMGSACEDEPELSL